MRYGLPYKGSKNKLAEKINALFPKAKHFYDLFCGGCAITHRALIENSFETYTINDINPMCTELFNDALHGKFKNEKRWISREDFKNSKEPYVRFCWSFGNSLKDYLYSKEIEPLKKALHFARCFNDFSLFKEMDIKLENAKTQTIKKNQKEIIEKYIVWYIKTYFKKEKTIDELKKMLINQNKNEELRLYLCEALKKSGLTQSEVDRRNNNQMGGHYFGKSQWQFPSREIYLKMQTFLPLEKDYDEIYGIQDFLLNFYKVKRIYELQSLESLERLQRLESLERLQRLESLESLERLQSLQSLERFNKSYDEIEIKKNSLVYCDIPYKGTDDYIIGFDHEKFYQWCKKQSELVLISSYEMPEDFICVAEFEHRSILSATANNKVIEKVFIPKHQKELWNKLKKQNLIEQEFDFGEIA